METVNPFSLEEKRPEKGREAGAGGHPVSGKMLATR